MSQFDKRNLSMLMDFYEMTMANGYFKSKCSKDRVVFDAFYRHNPDGGGFSIFAGLEQVVDYIVNLHFEPADLEYFRGLQIFDEQFLNFLKDYRFTGDVYAFKEGTIMYPNEPIITVIAPLIDAQLIETAILAQINHQSLIATKAQRIARSAKGRVVADFGARRAHNMDAAVYGARAAFIGGANATATVLAGKEFGIPITGTMAHSWVMFFRDEYEAFKQYALAYPNNCQFLIDTYDVLKFGLPKAIAVAKEVLEPMGQRLKAVRIDSGDLAYLSKKIRKSLDENGLQDCKIVASNSLDEYTISSILEQGGAFDAFGVGERLITAKSDPVFGAVYKLSAVEEDGVFVPRIKISEAVEKITNPGRKAVYRVYNQSGQSIADLIANADEQVDMSKPYRYVDPLKPWKNRSFENCTAKALLEPVIKNGQRVSAITPLEDIKAYVQRQLKDEIWDEEQRFENPHLHYIDMSPDYYSNKMDLLHATQD